MRKPGMPSVSEMPDSRFNHKPRARYGCGDKSAGAKALKSIDGLFLTDAAFMLRLHPKPTDADKSIV
jgi:hypothetical protein